MKNKADDIIGMVRISLITLLTALLATGCATMKKEECLTADWYQIGYEDGAKGRQASRIGEHRKACSKYDITPDLQAYLSGRNQGLRLYCTPRNAYQLGLRGKSYRGQCPVDLNGHFIEAFNKGRDVYHFKRDLKSEQRKLETLEQQLAQVEEEITEKEQALTKECTDQTQCRRILGDIRTLDNEKNRLLYDISANEDIITGMKRSLADMENRNRY